MSFENIATVSPIPFKKKKVKVEWLTIVTTILSLILGIAATSSGMLRDYYDKKLQEKKIQLEVLKTVRADFKEEQTDFAKRARTLSMVQINLVDTIKFCQENKKYLEKDPKLKKKFIEKTNTLASVLQRFQNESIDLEIRYGKNARDEAKRFAAMVKEYEHTCSQNLPPEEQWIHWQNAAISAMNKALEQRYQIYFALLQKNAK